MSDVGKSIVESFDFVSRVWSECDSLANELKKNISILIAQDHEVKKLLSAKSGWRKNPSWQTDASGCVNTAVGYSLPVKVKPKKSVSRYLCFQISLSGSSVAAIDNNEAMLHVIWWADPIDFKDGPWMGFPFDLDDELHVSIDEGVLFRWPSTDNEGDEWAYSLRLTSLNTIRDLKEKIVDPVKALLCGRPVREALPPTIEGLVHYAAVDGHNFRVMP